MNEERIAVDEKGNEVTFIKKKGGKWVPKRNKPSGGATNVNASRERKRKALERSIAARGEVAKKRSSEAKEMGFWETLPIMAGKETSDFIIDGAKNTAGFVENVFNNMTGRDRKAWSHRVVEQLREVADLANDNFTILAGSKYRDGIMVHIEKAELPLEGMGIGYQLKWLTDRNTA